MAGILFEDIFKLKDLDAEGKKFDRVSRIHCESESFKIYLTLDINSMIFPMEVADKFRLLLATTLHEDGRPDSDEYIPGEIEGTRADNYDYVMFGKVYRIEGDDGRTNSFHVSVYASFGGLLMRLEGDTHTLQAFHLDQNIYLLIKKFAL